MKINSVKIKRDKQLQEVIDKNQDFIYINILQVVPWKKSCANTFENVKICIISTKLLHSVYGTRINF